MSSSEEEEGILKKALDVELPDDFDPSKPPTTGEEYLQHVMYERKQCRKWLSVNIDPSKLKHGDRFATTVEDEPIAKAPAHMLPTKQWQQKQVDDFLQLRKFIAWQTKNEPKKNVIHESHWLKLVLQEKPKFSRITALKQIAKIKLLQLIVEYLKKTIANGDVVNKNVGIWIYSTLATLELPLNPGYYYELRSLAKTLAAVRARLNDDVGEEEYKYLNLGICLIAKVFMQQDLADV